MTAKSSRARHRRFLQKGFFPLEMPPCFYTETFATHRNFLGAEFEKIPLKDNKPDYYTYITQKTPFTFPRFGTADRRHSIINPISFFFLSRVISENYIQLRAISKKSRLSISSSLFDWDGERALIGPSFAARDRFISELNAQFEYIVSADIRGFYHSIYTHAIPWALHGKKAAKKNRSLSLVGNLIDLLCRNSQDGQTIGLPVGPDTSRLIAEIIGSAIDIELQKKLPKLKKEAIRFVDDFSLGCNDRLEAEKAVAAIRKATNFYELDLGAEKTSIISGGTANPSGWKVLIKSLVPEPPYSSDSIEVFIFKVSELAQQLPKANIEKFALQRARQALVKCEDWVVVENYLLALYKSNPTVINILVEIFILRHRRKEDLSQKKIRSFIEARLPFLCEHQRMGEAAWLLYMVTALQIKINRKAVEKFFKEEDPVCALLIADCSSRGLVTGELDFSLWNQHLTSDGLNSEMWLYAYETTLKSMNKSQVGDGFIKSHRYFSALYKKKVEFYQSGEGIVDIENILHRRRKENLRALRVADKFSAEHDMNAEDFEDLDALSELELDDFDDDDNDIY